MSILYVITYRNSKKNLCQLFLQDFIYSYFSLSYHIHTLLLLLIMIIIIIVLPRFKLAKKFELTSLSRATMSVLEYTFRHMTRIHGYQYPEGPGVREFKCSTKVWEKCNLKLIAIHVYVMVHVRMYLY